MRAVTDIITRRQPAARRWHGWGYWVLLATACAVFLVMNLLTTLKEDDLAYSLVEGAWTPVASLADVLRSFGTHYIHSNGRLADLVAMLYCGLLGKMAFNVCNTLVFGSMLHLISVLATGRRSLLAVSLALAAVGTCYPVPGETMLWLAGSCNYMWAITASLLLVYGMRQADGRMGWGGDLLLAVGAFIAGAFNEATSFGFLLGLVLYYAFNRRRFSRAVLWALAGYSLGVALIVSSPGAWSRAAGGGIVYDLSLADLLSSRWFIFHEKMWRFYLPVLALALGLLALLSRRGSDVRQCVWTYLLIALALVMFVLGITHERAYAPLVTVALMIVIVVAHRLLDRWPWLRVAVVAVALALGAFTFMRGVKMLREYKAFDDAVIAGVVQAQDQAVLRERVFPGYSRFVKPMNFQSSHFFAHELIYRAYYGKTNVQFVGDSVYTRYHEGRLLDGAARLAMRCDRDGVVDSVMAVPGQDYMAVVLHADTLPCSFQTARYYLTSSDAGMTARERARREDYGLMTDYNPQGFYPLRYKGLNLLIFPLIDAHTSRIVFPVELGLDAPEASLVP